MYIVKLTFNYDWPLFRQIPKYSNEWGNYKFVIDDNLIECDFWVVYGNYKLNFDKAIRCSPKNIIFVPAEPSTIEQYSKSFLEQFGTIITVQKEIKHKNIIHSHNANPWFVNKSYDELVKLNPLQKTKILSVVSSNKTTTKGQRKRLQFVRKVQSHFGDKIDIFGKGINDFEDKWEVLADYKYTIAIENSLFDDYFSEKFVDCLLAYTYPIYYGCPNLEKYFPKDSFQRIDIEDFEGSVKIIEELISSDVYTRKITPLSIARQIALNKENLFPFLVNILEGFNPNSEKKWIKLSRGNLFERVFLKVKSTVYAGTP